MNVAMLCFTVHLQRAEMTLAGIARSQGKRLFDDSREVHGMSAPLSGYSVPVAGSASTGVFSFAAANSDVGSGPAVGSVSAGDPSTN